MANPWIAVLFHLLYFLACVRETITTYRKAIRNKFRDSLKKTLIAWPKNYQQVYVAGRPVCGVSIRAKIAHTLYFRVRLFDTFRVIFQLTQNLVFISKENFYKI